MGFLSYLDNPTFPNKFAAPCKDCGKRVEKGEGMTSGPPWVTTCTPCLPKQPAAPPPGNDVVAVKSDPGGATIKPTGYLGGAKFDAYRAAAAGAKYDPVRRLQVARIDQLPRILDALATAGFKLAVDPDVQAKVQGITKSMHADVAAAGARAAQIDAVLRSRGKSLYNFQREGVSWLAPRRGALLADDMGLGKTVQALAALPDRAPVLVVSPAVAKGVWVRETAAWRPDYRTAMLSGRGSFRWPAAGEIIITNYDILPDAVGAPPSGTIVIADEAHALKNSKAARTKKFRAMADAVLSTDGRVWLLTATPILNDPSELWSILQAAQLTREAYGSWGTFMDLFGGYQGSYGVEWGEPQPESGERLKRVSLRRMKVDVLPDLPAKRWGEIPVVLDTKTNKALDKIVDEMTKKGIDVEAAIESAADSAGASIGFQQMSRARAILATAKIPVMIEVIEQFEENKEPLVVFSAHRAPIDVLATRPGWAVITGDTPPEKRTIIENDFQAGKLLGVGATIKAGGVAITLTKSSNVLFVDLDWTPALNAQAEDRICRIGQNRGCIITTLVADHQLDARVYDLLRRKQSIISGSVDVSTRISGVTPDIVDIGKLDLGSEYLAIQKEIAVRAKMAKKMPTTIDPPHFRQAATPQEEWAEGAIQALAQLDPDGAAVRNDVGFNRADGSFGHALAVQLLAKGLTDKQWALVLKLLKKYHRQVGVAP